MMLTKEQVEEEIKCCKHVIATNVRVVLERGVVVTEDRSNTLAYWQGRLDGAMRMLQA